MISDFRKILNFITEQNQSAEMINTSYNQTVRKWIKELTGYDSTNGGIEHSWKSDSGQEYPSVLFPIPNGMSLQHFKQAVSELRQEGFLLLPGQTSQGKSFIGVVYIGR